MQTTSNLLMIRPINFEFNSQTAVNNSFQKASEIKDLNSLAQKEFDALTEALISRGIGLTILTDTPEPHTPDSVFPNNWVSFHQPDTMVLYPMFAINRRLERKQHVLDCIRSEFKTASLIDLTAAENENHFLEGTGSMVIDRENRISYACISPRTDEKVFYDFCKKLNYRPAIFHAADEKGLPIYHTNVMMSIGESYAIICLESIRNSFEKQYITMLLSSCGKEIISIDYAQMNQFAGNMLQVRNKAGERFLVMSTAAYQSLSKAQIARIETHNNIIHSPIPTIEKTGGGSVRCMIAEVFNDVL